MKTEVVQIPEIRVKIYEPILDAILALPKGSALKVTPDGKVLAFSRNFTTYAKARGAKARTRTIAGELYIWADKPEAAK